MSSSQRKALLFTCPSQMRASLWCFCKVAVTAIKLAPKTITPHLPHSQVWNVFVCFGFFF